MNLNRGNTPSATPSSPVSLVKGERVSLTKGNASLNHIHVGLGWDVNNRIGSDFDLDASVFMVGENERVSDPKHFIYFNNLQSPEGSVVHTGDNLTGDGDGDDESIKVRLSDVPQSVKKLIFTVSIYDAGRRKQNFGQVENAFIRIVDETTGAEIIRFDLTEDFSLAKSLVVGELYRHNNEWKFNASGNGIDGEIDQLVTRYM